MTWALRRHASAHSAAPHVLAPGKVQRELEQASSVQELLAIIDAHASGFDSHNEGTAIFRLGTVSKTEDCEIGREALKSNDAVQTLLARIEARLLEDGFKNRDLVSAMHAMASLGVGAHEGSGKAWQLLAARAGERVEQFTPQELANIAWAFTKAGVPAPGLFDAVAKAAAPKADKLKPHDVSMLAWAFASASVPAPVLFAALARTAEGRLADFQQHALSNTAWSFSAASVTAPALFSAIAREVERRAHELDDPISVANLAWALSVAEDVPNYVEALRALGERALQEEGSFAAARSRHSARALDSHDRAMGRALLTASLVAGPHPSAPAIRALLELVRSRLGPPDGEQSSPSQIQLSKGLRAAGWDHLTEVPLEGGLLVVDMACPRAKIAVEFDGPSHFHINPATGEETHTARSLWKTRVLVALGWRVLRVGYRRWVSVGGQPSERRQFCEALAHRLLRAERVTHPALAAAASSYTK